MGFRLSGRLDPCFAVVLCPACQWETLVVIPLDPQVPRSCFSVHTANHPGHTPLFFQNGTSPFQTVSTTEVRCVLPLAVLCRGASECVVCPVSPLFEKAQITPLTRQVGETRCQGIRARAPGMSLGIPHARFALAWQAWSLPALLGKGGPPLQRGSTWVEGEKRGSGPPLGVPHGRREDPGHNQGRRG